MNSNNQKDTNGFSFSKPAVYQMKVKGIIEQRYSEYLGGMQIEIFNRYDNNAFTMLTGSVSDQSALAGILNALYEMHLSILSVKALGTDDH